MTDRITKAIKKQIHVTGDIQLKTLQMRTQEPNFVSCKINSWWYTELHILHQVRQGCNYDNNSCNGAYDSITSKSDVSFKPSFLFL
jgi:hypothetical protein